MDMIDWDRIGELRDEIGAEDFDEVAELFLAEVMGAIDSLESAVSDAAMMEEKMHFLKGAALNLGFSALSALCQKGETAATQGVTDAVAPKDVRQCFEQSQAQYDQQYPQRFAA